MPGWHRALQGPPAGRRPAKRRCGSLCQVPERAGRPFLILTVAFFALLLGSNLPTPLYAVYRERFGFSSAVLTLVFATYMVVLVPTLLLCGQLSDRVGRKRVVAAGPARGRRRPRRSSPPRRTRRGCSPRARCRGCRSGWSPAPPRPGSSSSSPTAIAGAPRSTRCSSRAPAAAPGRCSPARSRSGRPSTARALLPRRARPRAALAAAVLTIPEPAPAGGRWRMQRPSVPP